MPSPPTPLFLPRSTEHVYNCLQRGVLRFWKTPAEWQGAERLFCAHACRFYLLAESLEDFSTLESWKRFQASALVFSVGKERLWCIHSLSALRVLYRLVVTQPHRMKSPWVFGYKYAWFLPRATLFPSKCPRAKTSQVSSVHTAS